MSSEERQRREGEPREESREEPPEADRPTGQEDGNVSEPVEVGDSEDPGVVPVQEGIGDAESHAEEDQRRREEADVRNNADNLVYSIERSLKDVDGKVDSATRGEIEQAIEETKNALAGSDVEEIKRKQEALLTASHKLSEVLYQQAQQQESAAGQTGPDGDNPDDVVEDAEIIDEDEEKRK